MIKFSEDNTSSHFWKCFKSLTGETSHSSTISELIYKDVLLSSPSEISSALADSLIVKPNPSCAYHPELLLKLDNLNNDYIPFTPDDVAFEVKHSKLRCSANSNHPPFLFKTFSPKLCPILADIFNKILSTGTFPDQWKTSLVTPVLKPGQDPVHPNSYRPISVLPYLSKVFEGLLSSHIIRFCNLKKFLTPTQFGFRRNYSTFYALLRVTQKIFDSLDKKQISIGIFIDLVKAFGSVPHSILLDKMLPLYKFPDYLIKILYSYLSDRSIKIKLKNFLSDSYKLFCSVPQGSTIGPILFLLLINDITAITDIDIDLYADDIAFIDADSDLCNYINYMQNSYAA